MSLDGIRVNHGALDGAAAEMNRIVKNIDERLERLHTDLTPLRNDWHGSAKAAYQECQAAWDAAIGEMRDLLDRSAQTVYQSNADYAATDKKGAGYFGG